jgi:hypothetical protein
MGTILKSIHFMVAVFNTFFTFLCVDLPLKVILCIIFLILGFFLALIYPLVKNTCGPDWIGRLYDYATTRKTIAAKVWEMWKP